MAPESDSSDSTGALKEEMNSFVAHWPAVVTHPTPQHPISQSCPKPFWLKFKSICSLSAGPTAVWLLGPTCICCAASISASPLSAAFLGPPPTLAYKSQVCKHKSLPRHHKRLQISREEGRDKEQGDRASHSSNLA